LRESQGQQTQANTCIKHDRPAFMDSRISFFVVLSSFDQYVTADRSVRTRTPAESEFDLNMGANEAPHIIDCQIGREHERKSFSF
jgi:hypothetical protein